MEFYGVISMVYLTIRFFALNFSELITSEKLRANNLNVLVEL